MNLKLKRQIDIHSIRFKLWATFIGFALVLLALIWCLQIFFLRTYYEEMKSAETRSIATQIKETYHSANDDIDALATAIVKLSSTNDVDIIVMDESAGSLIINSDRVDNDRWTSLSRHSGDMDDLYGKLLTSQFGSVSTITSGRMKNRQMGYACYLNESTKKDYQDSYVLFLFSPLFPVKSTVSILRSQLIYITVISILLALLLAWFLSNRISRPLKDITASAAKMGQGNYNVQFSRGSFTEIDELADTLTHTEAELERTDLYQKDLIANVSHDLRTPLTMIKSYAEMIRDLSGDNPEKREKHLEVIIDETNRLNSLVTDMLNLSRMQSGKIILERSVFDINAAAAQIMASYNILSENDGYDIEFHNESSPIYVKGDESKIKQVMINLVNNAVKYCGTDKKIIVYLRKSGKSVTFSVTDHGQGIAPEELSHVWERYYKSSTHHVRSTEGSGLGLSIVKEILQLHCASYDVESIVGKGSTFWFEMQTTKKKS